VELRRERRDKTLRKRAEPEPAPKEEKATKQLGVQVDVEVWRRFRTLAFQKGVTATDMLREAMEEYIERHRKDVA
jgi:macrodomain Ter protein organizer (MatP/YcbG family)